MTDADRNRFIAEALEPEPIWQDDWECNAPAQYSGTIDKPGLWYRLPNLDEVPGEFDRIPEWSYALEQALEGRGWGIQYEYLKVVRKWEIKAFPPGEPGYFYAEDESRLVALRDAAFEALGGEG